VGPHQTSTGTPMGYALRMLIEPKVDLQSSASSVDAQLALAN
jgi:hypothetical protein